MFLKALYDRITVNVLGLGSLDEKIRKFMESNRDRKANRRLARKIGYFVLSVMKYKYDDPHKDYWQMPDETVRKEIGDCDDWAGLIFWLLHQFGFAKIRMGIFVNIERNTGHMMVLWYEDGFDKEPWVLDSTGAATSQMIRLTKLAKWWRLRASFDWENEYVHNN